MRTARGRVSRQRVNPSSLALDPEKYITRTFTPPPARPARPVRGPKFFMMPTVWAERLNAAKSAATFKVALHLLLKEFETHQQTTRLANVALTAIEVSRRQKWRALAELEKLGLIRVDRRNRKSPMVILLHLVVPHS
jgi:hypothetical protein